MAIVILQAVGGANPAYAPTVRIAQRWLGAHLLSNHFADEAVELLVAAAFTCPSASPPPGSRNTGEVKHLSQSQAAGAPAALHAAQPLGLAHGVCCSSTMLFALQS